MARNEKGNSCLVCQQNKTSTLKPAGLLQPLPVPTQVWDEISLDFIEGLPRSLGYDTILVVVDRFTKYAHFLSLKHPFNAQSVAALFVREIVRLQGFPLIIVSDRDKIFLSLFWRKFFRLQGTQLNRSTTHHPQSDGQTDVLNKILEMHLRCFVNEKPRKWAAWLPCAEYNYNTLVHSATNYSPFKALYERDPLPLIKGVVTTTGVSSIEEQLIERDAMLDELRFNLLRAQNRMKVPKEKNGGR